MVRIIYVSLVWAVAACSFNPNADLTDGAANADARPVIDGTLVDAPDSIDGPPRPDAPTVDARPADAYTCQAWSYAPSNFDPCDSALGPPTDTEYFTRTGLYVFDSTDSSLWYQPDNSTITVPSALITSGGQMMRVVSLTGLNPVSGVRVAIVGDYPVILAVFGTADVSGILDASGGEVLGTPYHGAGGHPSACSSAAGDPATAAGSGGGGGAGGAYGGAGGNGGHGAGPDRGMRGAGAAAQGSGLIVPLRGGCSGGGGGASSQIGGGPGGGAGGGLQVSVQGSLRVNAAVLARGGGGRGGAWHSGGGGAGSGGALLLEADTMTLTAAATVCAAGGSGGEGGGSSVIAGQGQLGSCIDGSAATTMDQSTTGGNGGNGGYSGSDSGAAAGNGSTDGGGGGGGGSVGRIRLRSTSTTLDVGSVVIPTPILN